MKDFFCKNCGEKTDNAELCENCSAKAQEAPAQESPALDTALTSPEQGNGNISISPDGKYRWLHETDLYRNPVFLFLMWKIFFFIWIPVALFVVGIASSRGVIEALKDMAVPMLGVLGFLILLVTFSYYVYALLMSGRYSVLFEMDKKGVRHTQLPKQFNKAQKISNLTALAGMAAGNAGVMGAGLLAAGNSCVYTDFKKVRSVRINRRKHIIKLRSGDLTHNQVYTAPEDFSFVLGFIEEQTGKAGLKQKR